MTGKRPPKVTAALASKTIRRFLSQRGLSEQALSSFLDPKLADLSAPDEMADRAIAAKRIARAVSEGEQIVVFGDYDCDGMTSCAILCDVLEELGALPVTALLASRFDGGYGVSERALERIRSSSPQLVITCDCGSSDHATLEQLRDDGVDVIVIDHHLVPEKPLPVVAFLNPHRPECGFPYKGLASCGLALSICAAVRAELGKNLDVRPWLDLVAIGSIADVAPLTQDNRALVKAGLARLRKAERPGLRALFELLKVDLKYPIVASDIAFRIAPRLNAPGRLGAPDAALALLREKDPHKAELRAAQVEQLCQSRRQIQDVMVKEAELQIAELGLGEAPALVLGKEGWNHGIVGIVAGRLAESYERPALVIGFHEGVGRGSVRGPAGFPLHSALSACADHLLRFGGHQAAAGMELRIESLPAFRAAFEQACCDCADYEPTVAPLPLVLDEADELQDVLQDLYLLEPCGEQNAAPRLEMSCAIVSSRELAGGHLKLQLRLPSGQQLGAFAPQMAESLQGLRGQVRVVGQLRADTYRGGDAIEMLVKSVHCDPA